FDVQEGENASSYLTLNFIVPDPNAPSVANLEGDQAFFEIGGIDAVLLDINDAAILTDPDNTDLNGGYIKLNLTAGTADEVLAVGNVGQVSVAGDIVSYAG